MFNLPMASNARVAVKEYCDLIGKRAQYVTRKKPRTADHAPLFSSRVKIGNRSFPGASGTRIKCAEEEAARQAVRILQAEGKRKWKPFVVGVAGRNHGRSRELTKKSSRPISGSISSRLRYRDSRDCSSRTKPGDAFSHKTRLFGGLTNYSERRVYHDTDIRKRRTNVSTRTRIASRSATPRNFKTRGRNDTACKDPVSSLHEYCRAHGYADPELINFSPKKQKMDHRPVYVFAYKIDYRCYRRGRGNNKKIAKKTAAKCALDEIKAGRVPKVAKGKNESVFDSFAALSWTQYNKLERDVLEKTDEWKIASSHKILAAIILTSDDKDKGQVVSLGTGNRCIAGNNLVMDGSRINDSHAEVIARRGFLRYLYHNLELFYDGVDQDKSIFRQTTRHSKLIVKNNIEFHLYISTAPCGDARVFANDSTRFSSKNESDTHVGHKPSFTSKLQGVLRTKIENGEGTIPLSDDSMKLTVDGVLGGQRLRTTSCSDKILRWNVLGLQGTLLSHLMEPVYLTSVTVGSLFNSGHHCRALCCRVETEKENFFLKKLPGNYRVNHPRIGQGLLSDKSEARKTDTKKTTALSLNWTMSDGNQVEITDGCTGLVHSSQTTSRLAKCRIYQTFKRIAKKAELLRIRDLITGYRDAKRSAVDHCNAKRQLMKRLEEKDYGSWQLIQKSK